MPCSSSPLHLHLPEVQTSNYKAYQKLAPLLLPRPQNTELPCQIHSVVNRHIENTSQITLYLLPENENELSSNAKVV